MAQIMGYLLNLLLLRGKFLTTTAATTIHKAFVKCLQFKKKISAEYKAATPMIGPFENMMEFINYNSRHYTCEGENYTVTSQVRYHLFEDLSKTKRQVKNCDSSATSGKKAETLSSTKPERRERLKKSVSSEHIVDNLQAILRSQEFCLKNMSKLVGILEKHEILAGGDKKLEQIKQKLAACSDILSNSAHSRKFSTIINNIIEEEITRCRFRNGESKTSEEISLKAPRPQGIEAALESKPKQKPEINEAPKKNMRRSKSEPTISKSQIVPQTRVSHMEDSRKVLEINEEQFHRFEDTLWHSLTTLKFMALKDDYLNRCRCAFYNKRHFVATELAISKKVKQQEEANVKEMAYQAMEQEIFYEKLKDELEKKRPHEEEEVTVLENQKFDISSPMKEQDTNTDITFSDLRKLDPKISQGVAVATITDEDYRNIEPRPKLPTTRRDQETNTIINSFNLTKCMDQDKEEPEKLIPTLPLLEESTENNTNPVAGNLKVVKDKIRYTPIAEVIKKRTTGSRVSLRNRKLGKPFIKKNVPEKTLSFTTLYRKQLNNRTSEKISEDTKLESKNSKLETVSNTSGKILTVTHEDPEEGLKISNRKWKSDGDLLRVNKKAFEDLEATIKNVRIFISKTPKNSPKSVLKTTTETKKRKIDEPPKKCMSTKQLVHVMKQQKNTKQEAVKKISKHSLSKNKSKTFLKNTTWQQKENKNFHSRKTELSKEVQIEDKDKTNSQMRRTTKNAMKRQQVVTIFPNVSKEADKKKPRVGLVETKETKDAKLKEKTDAKVTKSYGKRQFSTKRINEIPSVK